jgi:hypothetical protein
MRGSWHVHREGGTTLVVLLHDWEVAGSVADAELVTRAVDANSRRELAALDAAAGAEVVLDLRMTCFEDSMEIDASPEEILGLLWDGDAWPALLDHVQAAHVDPMGDDAQVLTMDTLGQDGHVHSSRSVRVRTPGHRISYKQLEYPATLSGHSGSWEVEETPTRARLIARHRVGVSPEGIAFAGGLPQALDLVRQMIGANSRRTMTVVKRTAEAAS